MIYAQDPLARFSAWLRKRRIRIVLHILFIDPFLLFVQGRKRWRWLLDQLGAYPIGEKRDTIWINAIGIGELKVAIALVRAFPPDLSIVITTHLDNFEMGRKALGERAEIIAPPLPFVVAVRRFLRRFSPRHIILVEIADLRPLINLYLTRTEIPISIVNGWVPRKVLASHPALPLLKTVQIFCIRSKEDCELLEGLGIPRERISITGEMKFDVVIDALPEIEAQLQKLAGERPILIAGSTHIAEAPQVLDVFERLGGGNRAMLILAPRFRPDLTERILRARRIRFVLRSQLPVSSRPSVVLLDTLGELASLYRLAAAAFVGWSLTPDGGGQNPIEPACFAVPFAVGPNTANFPLHSELFDRAGAWQRVADAGELAQTWATWLDNPELAGQMGQRAAELVESQRGLAMTKTLKVLRPFLLADR